MKIEHESDGGPYLYELLLYRRSSSDQSSLLLRLQAQAYAHVRTGKRRDRVVSRKKSGAEAESQISAQPGATCEKARVANLRAHEQTSNNQSYHHIISYQEVSYIFRHKLETSSEHQPLVFRRMTDSRLYQSAPGGLFLLPSLHQPTCLALLCCPPLLHVFSFLFVVSSFPSSHPLTSTCARLESRSSWPAFRALNASLLLHRSDSAASSASRRPSARLSRATSTSFCFRSFSCNDKNAALEIYRVLSADDRTVRVVYFGKAFWRRGIGACAGVN